MSGTVLEFGKTKSLHYSMTDSGVPVRILFEDSRTAVVLYPSEFFCTHSDELLKEHAKKFGGDFVGSGCGLDERDLAFEFPNETTAKTFAATLA